MGDALALIGLLILLFVAYCVIEWIAKTYDEIDQTLHDQDE